MDSSSRRAFVGMVAALALSAWAATPALGQQAASTWQQIKQRGELRIGVTPGEPWYFKDPASGQWSGIGYAMGQQIAKDLGVKLVPVETTWGNAVAAIQASAVNTSTRFCMASAPYGIELRPHRMSEFEKSLRNQAH